MKWNQQASGLFKLWLENRKNLMKALGEGKGVPFPASSVADDFLIDAPVADTYGAMARYMETHYYTAASRYTTSAFLRLKLGEALARRRVAPHTFETGAEAPAFVEGHVGDAVGGAS